MKNNPQCKLRLKTRTLAEAPPKPSRRLWPPSPDFLAQKHPCLPRLLRHVPVPDTAPQDKPQPHNPMTYGHKKARRTFMSAGLNLIPSDRQNSAAPCTITSSDSIIAPLRRNP